METINTILFTILIIIVILKFLPRPFLVRKRIRRLEENYGDLEMQKYDIKDLEKKIVAIQKEIQILKKQK